MTLHALTAPGDIDAPILVLLHGRGSDERDLFILGRQLHPEATVASVRAPFEAAPWGYGPGWAWYRFISGTTPEPESFEAGQRQLDEYIAELRSAFPDRPLVIGGFSQGGTTALAWAIRNPGAAAAVLVFSGFLADHPLINGHAGELAGTRVWWGHGTRDMAIPFDVAEAGRTTLRDAGVDLTIQNYENGGHAITREAVTAAGFFLMG